MKYYLNVDFFLNLESKIWDGLKTGDPSADAALLSDNFIGIYPSGFAGKDAHMGQLNNGPTVLEYSLSDANISIISEDIVLLYYYSSWKRDGAYASDKNENMYISSLWQKNGENWQNIFSQDTPQENK